MAKVSTKRQATIELTEEDWKKIYEVYDMISNLEDKLSDIGLELDSPEVKFKDCGDGSAIGEHLQSIYYTIDELYCEKSGLY